MLLAGSDDGVYQIERDGTARKVLDTGRVYRVRQCDGFEGVFAASDSGLYHSGDGQQWRQLAVPESTAYAVTTDPQGTTLYAGTRPARIYTADLTGGVPTDPDDWTQLPGFRDLRERSDWGLPRHDGKAQVRSLQTDPDAPGRLVADLERKRRSRDLRVPGSTDDRDRSLPGRGRTGDRLVCRRR